MLPQDQGMAPLKLSLCLQATLAPHASEPVGSKRSHPAAGVAIPSMPPRLAEVLLVGEEDFRRGQRGRATRGPHVEPEGM